MALRIFVLLFLLGSVAGADSFRFELRPLFKKLRASKKLIGLEIIPPSYNSGGNPSQIRAEARDLSNALGLHLMAFYDGKYIATFKKYHYVSMMNVKTIGLSLTVDKSDGQVLMLGSEEHWGIRLFNFDRLHDLTKKSGLYFTDPITQIVNSQRALALSDTPIEIKRHLIDLATWLPKKPRDGKDPYWPSADNPELKITYKPAEEVGSDPVPPEWQSELEWRKRYASLNSQAPLWDNPQAENLVQDICDRISRRIPIPDQIRPRCRIFASLAPSVFYYPGGDVFVTAGTLGALGNVDSLVFFLAHEVGHVYLRHITKALVDEAQREKFINSLSLLNNFGLKNEVQVRGSHSENALSLSHALLNTMSAAAEDEADQFAHDLGRQLGLNFSRIKDDFSRLQADFDQLKKARGTQASVQSGFYKAFTERIQEEGGGGIDELQNLYEPLHEALRPHYLSYRYFLLSQ